MPLESLGQPFNPDEPGRKLREVQVEQMPDQENNTQQRYDALKNSVFYDQERQLWRNSELMHMFAPRTQFLGLMTLAEFDPNSARQQWEALHQEERFNRFETEWTWGALSTTDSAAKLLTIALMSHFDKSRGGEEYAKYCQQVDASDAEMMPQSLDENSDIVAETELLHLLIQSAINPNEARNRYRALQSTKLYDEASYLWLSNYFADSVTTLDSFYSDIYLLSILVELQLEISGTEERYQAVKSSSLFDQDTRLWNYAITRSEVFKNKVTAPQLLAVIIESQIEKMKKLKNLSIRHSIPEERNF